MSDATDTTLRPLTARMRRAIDALLDPTHATIEDAAAAVDVPASTLRRWRKLPAFRAELADAVTELRSDTTRRLHAVAVRAVETLHSGMEGHATHAMLRAAETALRFTFGERIAIEQQAVVGNYVLVAPPKIDDLQRWAETYSPRHINGAAGTDPAPDLNGHGNGQTDGLAGCQPVNGHGTPPSTTRS